VGDTAKVLLYRLYVLEGGDARLMHNACLRDHPQGYSYSI
jgi:hypothetical protein